MAPLRIFKIFYLKKTTFIDQRALIYVVILLTAVNCVNNQGVSKNLKKKRPPAHFLAKAKDANQLFFFMWPNRGAMQAP